MTTRTLAVALVLAAVAPCQQPAAPAARAPGADEIAFLRQHGLEQSQVMDHLSWICDVHGPRLTGSKNLRNAQEWAKGAFTRFGLQNARSEPWGPFGRGWRCDHALVEVVGSNPWQVIAFPKAWSPSLPARVEAEVVYVAEASAEELASLDLAGKVVLIDTPRDVKEPFDATSKRLDAEALLGLADQRAASRPARNARQGDFQAGFVRRDAMLRIVAAKKPAAIFDRAGKGDYGTVFVQGASVISEPGKPRDQQPRARDEGTEVIPQFTLAVEHYNRMVRLLLKRLAVRVAVELHCTFFADDLHEYNVLAELPGSGPEIVMLGAHFDSWQAGTGCTDNGCGSAVVLEAGRLLALLAKEKGVTPRRTIRFALWSGEEQGLLGSRAYVTQHFGSRDGTRLPEHELLAGYFNLDNGTGRVRGVYLQGNEKVAPIFREWLKPFHDLGASTLTLDDTGGTDHLAFDAVGLPGFQFIQDPVSYDPKTHHSNMDVWDHAVADDLRQAATIMAAFAWHTAQRAEKLPRK